MHDMHIPRKKRTRFCLYDDYSTNEFAKESEETQGIEKPKKPKQSQTAHNQSKR